MSDLPPFSQLLFSFKCDPASEHLRFGQWFYNNHLTGYHGSEIDALYNTLNNTVALSIIQKFYENYQWPMN